MFVKATTNDKWDVFLRHSVGYIATREHCTNSYVIYATADEADAYMFYKCFFCLFFVFWFFSRPSKNTRQPFSGTAERIFMKLSNVVPKWGLGPQIIFGGLKTTHCALGGDAWRVTEN